MFRNYLITALRNVARHKLYSIINIAGLTVGIACAILILLFLRDELSYDRWIPGSAHLYRVETTVHAPGRAQEQIARAPPPLPPLMKETLPEVAATTRIFPEGMTVTVGHRQFSEGVLVVDPNFFEVIRLPLVAGAPGRVFANPESVVLSQKAARKYFGDADPLGKLVTFSVVNFGTGASESHILTVTGVLRDLPENTHLAAEILIPNTSKADQVPGSGKESWWNQAEFGYVMLAPNVNPDSVLKKLGPIIDRTANPKKELGLDLRTSQIFEFHLTPFDDLHLTTDKFGGLKPAGSWTTIYGFATIAALILLVACVNFTNLSTARAMLRAREIALRKTVGAKRSQLIMQFLGEALLTAFAGLVLALALVEVLLPWYSAFLGRSLEFHYLSDWKLFVGIVAGAIAAGLLSGVYPALILSRFRPGAIITTGRTNLIGSGLLRLVLVVMQFAVSIGLGIAAIVVFRQISYAHEIDMGFNRTGIVAIVAANLSQNAREAFGQALRANPDVRDVAYSSILPFTDTVSNSFVQRVGAPQSRTLIHTMDISPEFPRLYGMQLLSGRLLSRERGEDLLSAGAHLGPEPDGINNGHNILMNLTGARKFGYSVEDAIGKTILVDGSRVTIVGILADSKMDGPKVPVQATVFGYYPKETYILSLRISGQHVQQTLAFIDKTWHSFAPSFPVQRLFLSDIFETQFATDKTQGEMFALFVGIAIFIACLGLFGLAAFTAQRRTKEIGVRKIHGARTPAIVRLLLWQFSIPVIVANAVAWPVDYYYLHHWLEGYAYRISLSPIYFIAAGAVALVIAWFTVFAHALRVARASPIYALRYE